MAEFIKIGRRRINVAQIREVFAISTADESAVAVYYTAGNCEEFNSEEGAALLAWADSNLVKSSSPEPKPKKGITTA